MSFFQKRLFDVLGVFLLLTGVFVALSLVSYDARDPSFNHITDIKTIHNFGGRAGAWFAHPLLEAVGVAALMFVIAPLSWGISLIRKEPIPRFWLRALLLGLSIPLLTGALTLLDGLEPSETWPSDSFGGVMGIYINSRIAPLIGFYVFAFTFTFFGLFFAAYSWNISSGQWKVMLEKLATAIRATAQATWRGIVFTARLIATPFRIRREHDEDEECEEEDECEEEEEYEEDEEDEGEEEEDDEEEVGEEEEDEDEEEEIEERRGFFGRKTSKKKPSATIVSSRKRPTLSKRKKAEQASFDLDSDSDFQLPSLDLLKPPPKDKAGKLSQSALKQNAQLLEGVLEDFGINGTIRRVHPGPVVTLYELEPSPGTKSSRVIGLADDIARSMSAISARIAVIPGQNAIGVELPNASRETVYLRELLESEEYTESTAALSVTLGKSIGGEPVIVDLAKMPHLLIAGTTGSGKSVGVNAMILSLLYRYTPEECRFIMIDPKMLELSIYDDIPHLLSPVVTDPKKAVVALKWTVKEMENRYRLMANLSVRNIAGYNKRIAEAAEAEEELFRTVQTGFDPDTGKPVMERVPLEMTPLPFIVVIVDEMADLMLVAGKEIESSIQRLAQMARAAGIHIIMATQRPSVDVITGVIKANLPTRISFQVTSRIDSRTILGEQGAEQLLGMGDMLYMSGGSRITRVHGPFVDDKEVEEVVEFLKEQGEPEYVEDVTISEDDEEGYDEDGEDEERDELYDKAVDIVQREGKASTSFIQRQLKIGYNRAANIIDQMERDGVISEANHVGKREVLVRQDA
ncbi:MAG: DNA translocase FtsK 4TM domain-containing protein [Hyphomicrobiales bacterium]|nr:DNA translocase FtsK 4TM domain-containing protein [Hyphomicrobiales bacterium]